jgi:hypothetical protein
MQLEMIMFMQVTRMFYENALNVEPKMSGLKTVQPLEIIQKSLYSSCVHPVKQICVYLRLSAVNIFLIFIQLTESLNQSSQHHYTKPLKREYYGRI